MTYKGIERGDDKFRHFTFDDNDIVVRGGKQYCKVNYGKNKLEGDDGEDEIGFVLIDNIIALGGKKVFTSRKPAAPPTPISREPEPIPEPKVEVKTEPTPAKRKPGRPPKAKPQETVVEQPVAETSSSTSDKFEYFVANYKLDTVDELQLQLNVLGKDGWEMCGFDTNKSLFDKIQIIVIFKRKRG